MKFSVKRLAFLTFFVVLAISGAIYHSYGSVYFGPATFADLYSDSDYVLIGSPVDSVESGKKYLGWTRGINVKVYVKSVMRGKLDAKEITLLELQADPKAVDQGPVSDIPILVHLEKGTDYLLYLKKDADGFYVPRSGLLHPSVSIYRISSVLSDDHGHPHHDARPSRKDAPRPEHKG